MQSENAFQTIKQAFSTFGDKINEQEWYRELKGKWEQLEPRTRTIILLGTTGTAALVTLALIGSSLWSVHLLKQEYTDKSRLVGIIQQANDEMKRLRDTMPGGGATGAQADNGPWQAYLEQVAQGPGIGVDAKTLTVSAEKPGAATEQAKESLIDISLKDVNIRQVVNYVFNLENGSRPVKLRNLAIETRQDVSGYLNATLSISAFSLK